MNVIILGLGSFGVDSLRRLESSKPSAAVVMAALSTVDSAPGFSFQTVGGLTLVECPAGLRDTQTPDSFIDWCAGKFIELPDRSGTGTPRPAVVTIADREDPGAMELSAGLARLFNSSTDRLRVGPIEATGIFRLPPQTAAFPDESIYHRHFFVSGSNQSDTAAAFASLLAEPSFGAALGDIMEVRRARSAGVGLAGLVHPIESLVEEESDRFIHELVNEGLLGGAGELFYRQADEYLKRREFFADALREVVVADDEGTAVDALIVETRQFAGVPLSSWVKKIDGHVDYIGRERLPRIIGRLQRNLDRLGESEAAALGSELDDLMAESGALDKTGRFLDRLGERTAALKDEVESRAATKPVELKDPEVFRTDLIRRIKGHPEAVALAARSWLLISLTYFFGVEFVRVLGAFPEGYINPAYLPPSPVFGAAAAILTGLFIFLFLRRAQASLRDSRSLYIESLVAQYRAAVDRAGWRLLAEWLSGADVDEGEAEPVHSWSAALLAEQEALTGLRKLYLHALSGVPPAAQDTSISQTPRPFFSLVEPAVHPRYKRGRYDKEDESVRYAAGHHREWRSLGGEELAAGLDDFARAGLTFVDEQTLDRSLLEAASDRESIAALFDQLRSDSRPPHPTSSARSEAVILAALPGGRSSPLAADPTLLREAGVVDVSRPHQLIYVQLAFAPLVQEDAA